MRNPIGKKPKEVREVCPMTAHLTDAEQRELAGFVKGANRAREPFGWDATTKGLHAAVERILAARAFEATDIQRSILRYFDYTHLSERLQAVSKPYRQLALLMEADLPDGPEKSVALRKLLESKDAAVRAALDLPEL